MRAGIDMLLKGLTQRGDPLGLKKVDLSRMLFVKGKPSATASAPATKAAQTLAPDQAPVAEDRRGRLANIFAGELGGAAVNTFTKRLLG